MREFPNFVDELVNHFLSSGFDYNISFISTICLLSTLSPDFKVEALTYKPSSEELKLVDYPLNLYYVLSGEAGTGKSTLLDKMLNIYLQISPLKDNVISAKSSSMGIFKNLSDEWNYVLANGDDADWLLDPELKDGSINEALLKLWNRQYLEHLIQSKEFTGVKRVTFTAWIGIHGFNGINKEQIQNGLARRFIVYTYPKTDKVAKYSIKDIKITKEMKKKKKNLSERVNPKVIEKLKEFIDKFIKPNKIKTIDEYDDYRIYLIDDKVEAYLREVFDRVEKYLTTKQKFLDQVIRTYPEILQRFVAVASLWNGEMVVKEDDKYVNLGRSVSVEQLKKTDETLWAVMCDYYDELEKAKLGKIDYRIEDFTESIDDMVDFSIREGMTYKKDFVCPVWRIKRNYSIDIDKLKKIIETGISTERLKIFLGITKNGKKGYYLCSEDVDNVKKICKDNQIILKTFVAYNLIESLAL